eukprot:731303_1
MGHMYSDLCLCINKLKRLACKKRQEITHFMGQHGAGYLLHHFTQFRCLEDVFLMNESELENIDIVNFADRMAFRRLKKEYQSSLGNTQQLVNTQQATQQAAQPNAPRPNAPPPNAPPNPPPNAEANEEKKEIRTKPTKEEIKGYFRFGYFFIFHGGQTGSSHIRQRFANNTNKE